jgi:P27 family predicted phage terminase small subunit
MAVRGRKPAPAALKFIRGGTSVLPSAEPNVGAPAKPDWIADDPIASAFWDEVTPLLEARRVLSPLDGSALALLASHWSILRQARADLSEHGPEASTDTGGVKMSPAAQVAATYSKLFLGLATEFGLTPSSRVRLPVPTAPVRDRLTEHLDRYKKRS